MIQRLSRMVPRCEVEAEPDHQCTVLKDSGPLYSADYDAVKENLRNCSRYSAIRCADAVPMSSTEVQQAHEMTQAPPLETSHTKSGINRHSSLAKSEHWSRERMHLWLSPPKLNQLQRHIL
ncbi:DNA polymerase delta subunit 3-like [Oncorhynchus masou masou]|uniref:DNA polymerase delta subunit 3-like n=1 Tax=Oncorhynchus masou masou TaxID=90313 RepID=UPI003182CA5F